MLSLKEKKFREIERHIDEKIGNHPFFNCDRNEVVLFLLKSYEMIRRGENLLFLENIKQTKTPNINILFSMFLDRAMFLVFKRCRQKKKIESEDPYVDEILISEDLLKDRSFIFTIISYIFFERGCKMYSRKLFDVSLKKNSIKFIPKHEEYFRHYISEQRAIEELEKKTTASAFSIFNIISEQSTLVQNTKEILNFWLHRTNFFPSGFYIDARLAHILIAGSIGKINAWNRTIKFNWGFGKYCLEDLRKLWIYLDCKCSLPIYYLDQILSKSIHYPLFFIQKRKDWIDELSQGSQLSKSIVNNLIGDLTFNPNLENLGVRLQPFVPINSDYLALSPTLISGYVLERNFLDIQCKINKHFYDMQSGKKEEALLEEIIYSIKNRTDISYKTRVKVKKNNIILTDIDLIILEKSTSSLFLIQTKWLIRSKTTLELFAKDKELENGVQQAKKSYEFVSKDIENFILSTFPDTEIQNVSDIKIYSCVIGRENMGTSRIVSEEFPVIDYDCFKHYLDEKKYSIRNVFDELYKMPFLPLEGRDYCVTFHDFEINDLKFSYPVAVPFNRT